MDITIYKLTNKLNGMSYVGMTNNFKRRMKEHRRRRPSGGVRERGCRVDEIISRYGWTNFTAEVIEVCDAEIADERERHWIKELNTLEPQGYNYTTGGNKGTKFSSKYKALLSATQIEKTIFPVLQAELDKQQIPRNIFAQKLGFKSARIVSHWMNGDCEPTLSTAIKVKEVLGVDMPLEELFAKATAQQSE